VVEPIASDLHVDLYLPTGEISDTLVYQIAKDAAEDGRALVMFTLTDCDPAGRQMPVSIGRKLQALRNLEFPGFGSRWSRSRSNPSRSAISICRRPR
jgi:hypothetical protein